MSSAPVRWSSRWHVRAVVLVVLELEITMSSFRGQSSEPPRSVLNETVQQTLADLTAVDQQPTMRRWTTFTAMQTASDLRIVHRPGMRRSRQVAASVLDELA